MIPTRDHAGSRSNGDKAVSTDLFAPDHAFEEAGGTLAIVE
jgi:hypothetical protein